MFVCVAAAVVVADAADAKWIKNSRKKTFAALDSAEGCKRVEGILCLNSRKNVCVCVHVFTCACACVCVLVSCWLERGREREREMESKEKTHLSNIAFLLSSRMDGIGSVFYFCWSSPK